MTTITKELNLLDVEDIENAVSDFLGESVKISDIDCVLFHAIDTCDGFYPGGSYFELATDEGSCDSFDLFEDDELDGKPLALGETIATKEEIFNFDVSLFRSFEEACDGSD